MVSATFTMLERHLRAFGRDVVTEEDDDCLVFRRGHARFGPVFSVLREEADAGSVSVAFRRFSRARSKRVLDARSADMPHLPYRVLVEAPGDIDSELLSWMRESYEIAEA